MIRSLALSQFLRETHSIVENNHKLDNLMCAILLQVVVVEYTTCRTKHVLHGKYIIGVSMLGGSCITVFKFVMMQVFTFTSRYIIPIVGKMVGNKLVSRKLIRKK